MERVIQLCRTLTAVEPCCAATDQLGTGQSPLTALHDTAALCFTELHTAQYTAIRPLDGGLHSQGVFQLVAY